MVGNRSWTNAGSRCCERQVHGRARALDLGGDGARHHVAGRQVAGGVRAVHESLAVRVDQAPTFATQRLGQEESRRARHAQHRRVELHELEVGHARARQERHGHPVAARDERVRGLSKQMARAAGGDERAPRAHRGRHAVAVDERRAHARAVLQIERQRQRVLEHADAGVGRHAAPQHPADLAARGVARMEHAPHAVRGLAAQRRPALRVAIEGRAPLHQLGHVPRTVGDQRVHGPRIAEAVSRGDGVACVKLRGVIGAHRRGDAALCVPGVALARMGLAEDGNLPDRGQRERGALSRHAAADHQKVGRKTHDAILST